MKKWLRKMELSNLKAWMKNRKKNKMQNKDNILTSGEIDRRAGRFAKHMMANHNLKESYQTVLIVVSFIMYILYGLFVAETPRSLVGFSVVIILVLFLAIPHVEKAFFKEAEKWAESEENDKKN